MPSTERRTWANGANGKEQRRPIQLMGSDRSNTARAGEGRGADAQPEKREQQETKTEEPSIDERDEGRCRGTWRYECGGRRAGD